KQVTNTIPHVPFPALVSTMTHIERERGQEFQVKQSRRIGISPNGSVTIVCECSKNDTKDWKLEMKLEKESDSEWFCMASEHGTSKENCIVKQKDWKRVEFTLTNLESDHFDIYICKFTREKPVPIVEKQGTGTIYCCLWSQKLQV
uniref:Immunoglobulin subtype domain-containing protein n=1 Tax=Scleropages formosus TaxID=113540 RepID=A0A8C9WCZ8_SCLFO